jgi:hypothetical protein
MQRLTDAGESIPNDFMFYTEGVRATYEMAMLEWVILPLSKPVHNFLPKGDGRSVLVVTGFLYDDNSTNALRNFLNNQGYSVHGWDAGTNLGLREDLFIACLQKIEQLHEQHGQPVTIIGQSLGGIYARELAKLSPLVGQVICLGSPADRVEGGGSRISEVYELMNPDTVSRDAEPDVKRKATEEPPVPCTMIFSKEDGIVSWKSCMQNSSPSGQSENIRVYGSHGGMGFNPAIYYVLADRLSQSRGSWQPFKAPLWLQGLFPEVTH